MTLFEGHRTHRNAPCTTEPILDDDWDDEIEQPARVRGQRVYPHPGEQALLWATNNAHLAEVAPVLMRARLSTPRRFTIRILPGTTRRFVVRDQSRPWWIGRTVSLARAFELIEELAGTHTGPYSHLPLIGSEPTA